MLKGINIEFADKNSDKKAEIRLDQILEGRDLTIQNALIHATSDKDSNQFFEQFGTNLIRGAANGQAVNRMSAIHLSNFAALDTLIFMVANEDVSKEPSEKVKKVRLTPLEISIHKFSVGINATFEDNTSYNQIVDF